MKIYRLIFFFLCFGFVSVVSAQDSFDRELSIGANGGLTFSSMRFTPNIRQKSLMQFEGGLSTRFISENHFGIQVELNYSQRGWEEYNPDVPEHQYSRGLNYLELPLLTHIYFDTGKHLRLVFNLGPQLGYLLNESVLIPLSQEERTALGEEIPEYYDQSAQRRFDWGICGGGGLELRTTAGSFVLEGRYYFGLSDIFNNGKADYFASSANQVIGVKLTYFYKNNLK